MSEMPQAHWWPTAGRSLSGSSGQRMSRALRTVAIYSHEDRFAVHRLKADEAYQVGVAGRAHPKLS